ncbi:MAG: protein translocase subunit SecF [Clostridia bacterium]|nr:protein translocase subunit SecF [Clostridia bacterium]
MKNTFTKHTRLCLCISGAIIIAALILQVAGLGLNLGIDFTGGSILEYSVGENYDVADVEKILTEVGFTDAHITKAAPSAASEMLQAQRTTEEAAEPVLSDEDAAAVESGEAHVHADGTVHYGEHTEEENSSESTVGGSDGPDSVSIDAEPAILSMDKSGVKEDGLTDLQIRLRLVDEAANMEACAVDAVQTLNESAALVSYAQLSSMIVNENGYDAAFAGGYALEFDMGAAFDVAEYESAVNEALAAGGYSINNIAFSAFAPAEGGEETGLRILVDLDDTTSQVRSILETEMRAKYPGFHFVSISHVSATASRDLLANAMKALLIAFVLMLIYIAIRFDAMSGLAALFALVHDVLIMMSFMVFFRAFFQVNSSFIAAVLTIVGYSINNTIIIFDRIRENAKRPGFTQKPKMEIVELSVSSTLSRTINTTVTTMITLVALYVFGVESVREFGFPLIVGMLAGVYSSVLLSGQVWAIWSEKLAAKKA